MTEEPASLTSRLERALEIAAPLAELIVEAERLQVTDREVRARLSAALHECARRLNREGHVSTEPYVWAAIRMMAVFGEPKDLARLTEFLDPVNSREIRQVALQAIANVSVKGPQPRLPELARLRNRVRKLTRLLCHPEVAPLVAAQAISAVVAGVALGLAVEHRGRRAFERHPLLARQLGLELFDLMQEWRVQIS